MMKAVLLTLLVSSASAFAPQAQPQQSSVVRPATAELTGLVGVDLETGKKIFDPVGIAQWAPVDHLRKAELSNGRSAMLATVGWFWPSIVGTFDSQDVTTTDPVAAIMQSDPQWWAQFLVFCGTIEAIKFRGEQEGKSYTGDRDSAVIDWTGTWAKLDEKQKEDMRLKELKNGRLAMIGFAGLVSDYFIPGSVPGTPHFF